MHIVVFLHARLDEMQAHFKTLTDDSLALMNHTNLIQNMRAAVDWHQNWPVLMQTKPELNMKDDGLDVNNLIYQMTSEIEWHTQQEYRTKFGEEPPTAPLLLAWVQQFSWHPDFQDEWRIAE